MTSILEMHNLDPSENLIQLNPRKGEEILRTEDIIAAMDDTVAIVLLPGIQYYTGQLLDIKALTAAGRATGCVVGWDMAHAIGNVPLKLHNWDVDFAVWCTYKVINPLG